MFSWRIFPDQGRDQTYFIKGVKVDGAKVGVIEKLLGGENIPFDASDPE